MIKRIERERERVTMRPIDKSRITLTIQYSFRRLIQEHGFFKIRFGLRGDTHYSAEH